MRQITLLSYQHHIKKLYLKRTLLILQYWSDLNRPSCMSPTDLYAYLYVQTDLYECMQYMHTLSSVRGCFIWVVHDHIGCGLLELAVTIVMSILILRSAQKIRLKKHAHGTKAHTF